MAVIVFVLLALIPTLVVSALIQSQKKSAADDEDTVTRLLPWYRELGKEE